LDDIKVFAVVDYNLKKKVTLIKCWILWKLFYAVSKKCWCGLILNHQKFIISQFMYFYVVKCESGANIINTSNSLVQEMERVKIKVTFVNCITSLREMI